MTVTTMESVLTKSWTPDFETGLRLLGLIWVPSESLLIPVIIWDISDFLYFGSIYLSHFYGLLLSPFQLSSLRSKHNMWFQIFVSWMSSPQLHRPHQWLLLWQGGVWGKDSWWVKWSRSWQKHPTWGGWWGRHLLTLTSSPWCVCCGVGGIVWQ